MSLRTIAIGFAALALPLTAVACGGEDDSNSGERPTVAELTDGYSKQAEKEGVPAELVPGLATCLATGVHDSDLPNGVLLKLANGEEAEVDKDNEDEYKKILSGVEDKCVADAQATAGAGG